ncbi:hypothetical protein TNCV_2157361 [Trichonephila clavipes]|nr:hypothetical protein TNCV_2157361 [Trichonephila clavipes]
MTLDVTGKWNTKCSSIPYLDCFRVLVWLGLPERECPYWWIECGKGAWLRDQGFSSIRIWRENNVLSKRLLLWLVHGTVRVGTRLAALK